MIRLVRVTLLFALIAASGIGQTISGDLVVNVADSSGAVVTNGKLTLIEIETGIKTESTTDTFGNALFFQLKPGQYRLEVEASGFRKAEVGDIRVQVGQRARLDVQLQVGQITESVTVSAAGATLLNAESSSIGQVLDQRSIVDLPLSGRNFLQLAALSAGAMPIGIAVSPATTWTGRSDMTLSVAGGRESNNSFLLNGIETRNARFGSVGIRPSVEAIQEFKIQRSTFGAEFGRSAAVVNTTMRSGTNDLHGSVFEFFQNRELNANDFFLNRTGRPKPPSNQNNFGTAIGGPVWIPKLYNGKNRTFWFFNYESFRQRSTSTVASGNLAPTGNYPSLAQLQGNLADDSAGTGILPTSSPLCQANPGSRKCVDVVDPLGNGAFFPGNVIPANRLDPITQKAIPFIPVPNVAVPINSTAFPSFNTIGTPSLINDWDQYNVRIDHQLTPTDQIFGTFSWSDETRDAKALRPLGGEGYPLANRLVTATWLHTFSATMLNDFRFGFNRSRTFRLSETSFGEDYARDVFGLQNTTDQPIVYGVPAFTVNGFSSIGSISQAIGATDENLQFTDNFSIIRGKHNLRTGFQISRQSYYQITNFSGNPTFTFDGRYTRTQTAGYGFADFLLGIPGIAQGAIGDGAQDMRSTFYGAYVQDDWRVTSNFNINIGIRYEFARSPVEINNRSVYFNPEQAKIFLAGQGVRPDIVDPDYNNFAPRFGFTWNPKFLSKFVIRGGYGIYYSTDNLNEEQFKTGPPFFQSQRLDGNPTVPNLFMSNMLPSFSASPNLTPFTFDRLNRTPYLSQWSFGFEKVFGNNWVFEAQYAGSQGSKMPQRRNLNAAWVDPTGTIPVTQRIPYPQFGAGMLLAYNGGWTSYNALTTKIERRYASGLYLLGSYTWQKSLDLGATDDFSTISAELKKWDKGRSTLDVPHRFIASFNYELPFGRGKKYFADMNKATDLFLGGWQVNSIATFAQGQFQTLALGGDWIQVGSFSRSIPNIVGDPFAGRSTPDRYWNPAAFDFPRDAQGNALRVVGNAGRNTFQQPGVNNWDMGLFKNFKIGERFNTQFRWETFNTWNHTQFGSANTTTTNAAFGTITSLRTPARRMQFGLKLLF